MADDLAALVLAQKWFYPFQLPSGRRVEQYVPDETTILDLEGAVDSGHYDNTNYMHGYFGLFSGNPDNIDGSASDIVFYPSPGGLMWVLRKLGFQQVRKLSPPPGAYQQLATGKQIIVEARL